MKPLLGGLLAVPGLRMRCLVNRYMVAPLIVGTQEGAASTGTAHQRLTLLQVVSIPACPVSTIRVHPMI